MLCEWTLMDVLDACYSGVSSHTARAESNPVMGFIYLY
jgi:hypothetical protein